MKQILEQLLDLGSAPREMACLLQGLPERKNPVDRVHQKSLIDRIATSYDKAVSDRRGFSTAYQPMGSWAEQFQMTRAEYLDALRRGEFDRFCELLENFMRNGGVSGLWTYDYYDDVVAAGFRRRWAFVRSMLKDFAVWKEFSGSGRTESLAAPLVGNPWGCVIEGNLVMPVSFRHHYFATRILSLLSDLEQPIVAEIGSGFGGMAYFLLAACPRAKVVCFDLPEILLMAQYYLMSVFPDRKFLLYGEPECAALTEEVIRRYDIILMPNYQIAALAEQSVDLFVNTGSFSEMSTLTIQEYLRQIERTCRKYLLHENSGSEVEQSPGYYEVKADRFPVNAERFRQIYKHKSLWAERYREFLYERRPEVSS